MKYVSLNGKGLLALGMRDSYLLQLQLGLDADVGIGLECSLEEMVQSLGVHDVSVRSALLDSFGRMSITRAQLAAGVKRGGE